MAQREIVVMQVRMGKQRDLPDALELGQISLSTDVGRCFVGLPSNIEPSSLVAGRNWINAPNSGKENVEIITEFTPSDVINRTIYKPYIVHIPSNSTIKLPLSATMRLFMDYIAYEDSVTSGLLESGVISIAVKEDGNAILYQNSNTNDSEGLKKIEFTEPSYNVALKILDVNIENTSDNDMTVEFVMRGWDKQ